jgi:hypothetical protein
MIQLAGMRDVLNTIFTEFGIPVKLLG